MSSSATQSFKAKRTPGSGMFKICSVSYVIFKVGRSSHQCGGQAVSMFREGHIVENGNSHAWLSILGNSPISQVHFFELTVYGIVDSFITACSGRTPHSLPEIQFSCFTGLSPFRNIQTGHWVLTVESTLQCHLRNGCFFDKLRSH